jgi:hypothetical protein
MNLVSPQRHRGTERTGNDTSSPCLCASVVKFFRASWSQWTSFTPWRLPMNRWHFLGRATSPRALIFRIGALGDRALPARPGSSSVGSSTRNWRLLGSLALALFSLVTSSLAESTNAPTLPKSDFERYRIIGERNIFNAGRSGRTGLAATKETKRAPRVDTVALVGVMSYEKGTFAFFEGSSSDFRKVLKTGGTIAGYTVREITAGGVRLQSGETTVQLKVNNQLRREDDGEWEITARTDPGSGSSSSSSSSGSSSRRDRDSASTDGRDRRGSRTSDNGGSSTATSSGGPAGDASEILKRLMQQREQELK